MWKMTDKDIIKDERPNRSEPIYFNDGGADNLGVNNAIDCIHDFCKARKGRCIDCPAYITFRIESGDTVQTCKFRCDAPVNWEHLEIGGADDD
jgi:hypothetical protein